MTKIQMVMVVSDARIECIKCGALAIVLRMASRDEKGNVKFDGFCQEHFFFEPAQQVTPENDSKKVE